jgi:hypothetical protein
MANSGEKQKPLETIWRVPDELWNKLRAILAEHDPPKPIGRKRINHEQRWKQKKYPARRWVVERTLGWLSKCRAILVRY